MYRNAYSVVYETPTRLTVGRFRLLDKPALSTLEQVFSHPSLLLDVKRVVQQDQVFLSQSPDLPGQRIF